MRDRMTVGALISVLEQFEDDLPIIAVHQPGYPLLEEIKGIADSEQLNNCEDECGHIMDVHGDEGCTMCECGYIGEKTERILYLVIDGSPYDINPYGPRTAFDDYTRP